MMSNTKYPGVFKEKNGKFRYAVELGVDKVSGKRITKKGRKTSTGEPFTSAYSAHKELVKVKQEYLQNNGYANYRITYDVFMEENFLPYYKTTVEKSTWRSRQKMYKILLKRFEGVQLRDIKITDCENFRIWLLDTKKYSKGYSSLVYGAFRRTLAYAVLLGYLPDNVSMKTKAIGKGKSVVKFWTKLQFEKVISVIYTDDISRVLESS